MSSRAFKIFLPTNYSYGIVNNLFFLIDNVHCRALELRILFVGVTVWLTSTSVRWERPPVDFPWGPNSIRLPSCTEVGIHTLNVTSYLYFTVVACTWKIRLTYFFMVIRVFSYFFALASAISLLLYLSSLLPFPVTFDLLVPLLLS